LWDARRRRLIWQRRIERRRQFGRHNQRTIETRRSRMPGGSVQPPAGRLPLEDDEALLRRLLGE
jgi:hypothetical protein